MKRVRIADLKARLSEHLRYVRRGQIVTVLDRETPVAQIVPVAGGQPLESRLPAGRTPIGRVPLPRPLALDADILDLLREERTPAR